MKIGNWIEIIVILVIIILINLIMYFKTQKNRGKCFQFGGKFWVTYLTNFIYKIIRIKNDKYLFLYK